jgi:DNA-binding NtrC family response regulator
MRSVYLFAKHDDAPILIEGESGTGKTVLARVIHDCSPRADRPFQHTDLSALDDGIASSALFGHVAGAFTDARSSRAGAFASAHRGTVFLDEIGKASRIVQQKLLHAIEYGVVRPLGTDRDVRADVRVLVATNRPLDQLVETGTFLADLYARLMHLRIRIPALRERRADIPILATECLAALAFRRGVAAPRMDPDLVAALKRAPWPYNLRQLSGTIQRLFIEADGADPIALEHCRDDLQWLRELGELPADLSPERLAAAMKEAGTVTGAARLLGVHRTTVQRHRRRLDENKDHDD